MATFHWNGWASECATLEVGCHLKYWNGSNWVDADDEADVVSGKFSDGTYCYTVTNGVITAKDTCTIELYMNLCCDTTADGSGYVQVRAQSQDTTSYLGGTLINVATNVTINFTINGADTGQITSSITISSGTSNNGPTSFGPGFGIGEPVSSLVIDSVSPSSGTGQNYNAGSTNIGSC